MPQMHLPATVEPSRSLVQGVGIPTTPSPRLSRSCRDSRTRLTIWNALRSEYKTLQTLLYKYLVISVVFSSTSPSMCCVGVCKSRWAASRTTCTSRLDIHWFWFLVSTVNHCPDCIAALVEHMQGGTVCFVATTVSGMMLYTFNRNLVLSFTNMFTC